MGEDPRNMGPSRMAGARGPVAGSSLALLAVSVALAGSCSCDARGDGNERPPMAPPRPQIEILRSTGEFVAGSRRFQDPVLGFEFEVPENLERSAQVATAAVAFHSAEEPHTSLTLTLGDTRDRSRDQLLTAAMDDLRTSCPAWRLLGARDHFSQSGDSGYLLDFQWLAQGRPVRQRQILFASARSTYILTATWPAEKPLAQDDPLARSLGTFRLLPIP